MARESAAFYNAFFLDHDDGGVYFNVLANGLPYLLGNERLQGQPLDVGLPLDRAVLPGRRLHQPADHRSSRWTLYFKPKAGRRSPTGSCGSRPTCCRPGSVRLTEVWVNDQPYADFDAEALTVNAARRRGGAGSRCGSSPPTDKFDCQPAEPTAPTG